MDNFSFSKTQSFYFLKNILSGSLFGNPEKFTDILVPEEYADRFLLTQKVNSMNEEQYEQALQAWSEMGQTVPEGHFMTILVDNTTPSPNFEGRVKVKFISKY